MTRFIIVMAILFWSGLVQAQDIEPPPPPPPASLEVDVEEMPAPPLRDEGRDYSDLVITWDGREWHSSEHENMPDRDLFLITDQTTDYDGDGVPDVVWRGWSEQTWKVGQVGIRWTETIFAFYSPGKDEVYWVAYRYAPKFAPRGHRCGNIIDVSDCLRSKKIPARAWDALLRASEIYGGYPRRPFAVPCAPTRPRCKKFLR